MSRPHLPIALLTLISGSPRNSNKPLQYPVLPRWLVFRRRISGGRRHCPSLCGNRRWRQHSHPSQLRWSLWTEAKSPPNHGHGQHNVCYGPDSGVGRRSHHRLPHHVAAQPSLPDTEQIWPLPTAATIVKTHHGRLP